MKGKMLREDLLPFNDPKYIAEPYVYWSRLRDEAPVYWCRSTEFWAVTRYDDGGVWRKATTSISSGPSPARCPSK